MYRITIVKLETKEFKTKEWKKQYDDDSFLELRRLNPEEEQYQYVETTVDREIETVILAQTVDKLPLEDVIKAINGID